MCGICGIINFDGSTIILEELMKMNNSMYHRGPDDCGAVIFGSNKEDIISFKSIDDLKKPHSSFNPYSIGLAHRRLAIIDLTENAHQPMSDSTGRYHIVYNGEVYNFKTIRKELEEKGYIFKSKSDTEIILYSYIEWGAKCLNKFNGMFAFAIWDNQEKNLFLARDRFGKKPLYYYRRPNGNFIFASELTALSLCSNIPKDLYYPAINCYLAIGYILSPMSMYKDIEKLEPSHYIIISNNGRDFIKMRYWNYADLFKDKSKDSEKEAMSKITSLLEEAVKRRTVSDVPVGAFLSGGIDSSSVVAMMKKHHKGELHTFSIGFEEDGYNELTDADRAAKWIGTIHHNKLCKPDGNINSLFKAIDIYDELFSDTSLVPMAEVSKLAAEKVKVVLSGDGADEIFAGYITHKASKYQHYMQFSPNIAKKAILNILNKYSKVNFKKLGLEYRMKQFLYGSMYPEKQSHYLWRNIFTPEERVQILGHDYRKLIYDTDPFIYFKKYYNEVKDLSIFDQHLYVDIKTWLADDILVKLDRATMNSSIEARCPYLDIDLVSYLASLPYTYKLHSILGFIPYKQKYILKKSLKTVLPEFILKKKKEGFNAPIGRWLNDRSMNEFKLFNKIVFKRKLGYAK